MPAYRVPFNGNGAFVFIHANPELERVLLAPILALVRVHDFLQVAVPEVFGIVKYLLQLPMKHPPHFHNPVIHTRFIPFLKLRIGKLHNPSGQFIYSPNVLIGSLHAATLPIPLSQCAIGGVSDCPRAGDVKPMVSFLP